MDGDSMNLDRILQNVMQNPEMLKGALDLAGKLSSSGALSSLFSSQEKEEPAPETEKKSTTQAVVAKPKGKPSADLWRHRKLIEALSLYVSEDKREKFELVLKLFDLMELAGNLKH